MGTSDLVIVERGVDGGRGARGGLEVGGGTGGGGVYDNDVRSVSTLRLEHVGQTANGRYTCMAVNKAGSVNHTYTVKVIAG